MAKKKTKTWSVQIEQSIVVSHEFKAETLAEATAIAQKTSDSEWLIKPKSRAWVLEYECDSKVTGIWLQSD